MKKNRTETVSGKCKEEKDQNELALFMEQR